MRSFIGTSGWLYRHWAGRFYPAGLPARRWLAHLATYLETVEINGTFYRLQRPECFASWRAQVPPTFTFAVKGSRYLTHMLKLSSPKVPLANFFAQGTLELGAQLGPILWQLPPQLGFSAERAKSFFALLPRDLAAAEKLARKHDARLSGRARLTAPDGKRHRIRHALEVRHPSWLADESLLLMKEHDIALVAADTAGKFPLSLIRTADFAYLRLHGHLQLYASRYTDTELDRWAEHIARWLREGSEVYVYFDNDNQAYAPGDALRLRDRVQGGRHDLVHEGNSRGMQRSHPLRSRRDRRLRRGDRRHQRDEHQRSAASFPRRS